MTPELLKANFSTDVFDKPGSIDTIKIAKILEDEFVYAFRETARRLSQNMEEIFVLTADGVLGWVLSTNNSTYNRFVRCK